VECALSCLNLIAWASDNNVPHRFFYRPLTLTALALALGALAYVATTSDVLEEGRDKRRVYVPSPLDPFAGYSSFDSGIYASIVSFLLFSMLQFRDGPYIRPHPSFWRIILGINLLYELALVFLLFQDIDSARELLTYIDPNLGRPLPEKSYGENCALTVQNVFVSLAHPIFPHILTLTSSGRT
jgi:phosphatidylserine synthase 2